MADDVGKFGWIGMIVENAADLAAALYQS